MIWDNETESVYTNFSGKPDGEIAVRPVIRVNMRAEIFSGE
jgi:hypothetical protein